MAVHTEGPKFGADEKFSERSGLPEAMTNGTPDTAWAPRRAMSEVVSTLRLRLRALAGGDPIAAGKPEALRAAADQTNAAPANVMIKPSARQRALIDCHRDDWP